MGDVLAVFALGGCVGCPQRAAVGWLLMLAIAPAAIVVDAADAAAGV